MNVNACPQGKQEKMQLTANSLQVQEKLKMKKEKMMKRGLI